MDQSNAQAVAKRFTPVMARALAELDRGSRVSRPMRAGAREGDQGAEIRFSVQVSLSREAEPPSVAEFLALLAREKAPKNPSPKEITVRPGADDDVYDFTFHYETESKT